MFESRGKDAGEEMRIVGLIFLLVLTWSNPVMAWWFSASSQGECVKKYVSNVSDKETAETLVMACMLYFRTEDKIDKKFAECLILDASKSKNYASTQVIFLSCLEKYPLQSKRK